jgi:hypothetical protein
MLATLMSSATQLRHRFSYFRRDWHEGRLSLYQASDPIRISFYLEIEGKSKWGFFREFKKIDINRVALVTRVRGTNGFRLIYNRKHGFGVVEFQTESEAQSKLWIESIQNMKYIAQHPQNRSWALRLQKYSTPQPSSMAELFYPIPE